MSPPERLPTVDPPGAPAGPVAAVVRGSLRVYLGAAPGVGKTFAMLGEGRRRRERGADVVVGFVETYGRERTAAEIGDLEVVPRLHLTVQGVVYEEMDVPAIVRRAPSLVLVDELAHRNAPGSVHRRRWEDVEELLGAGIDVVTTLNIGHLESVNDVVERITGVREVETIPDALVRQAQQVELVDSTPEALRRRLAHGNIFGPDQFDPALANYFRSGNLAALRELALLWVADQVEVGLSGYRDRHGVTDAWETRERVVVAITGAPGTEGLIRRAARIARRSHGSLTGVHVVDTSSRGLGGERPERAEAGSDDPLGRYQQLVTDLGGEYHEIAGTDPAASLVEFARSQQATQLVLGASRQSRWSRVVHGSTINRVVEHSGAIDVHVVSGESRAATLAGRRGSAREGGRRASSLPRRRRLAAWLVAGLGVPALTGLLSLPHHTDLSTVLLLFLSLVVAVAGLGGAAPALFAAVTAFGCANWFFTPPFHELTIAQGDHVVALAVFLAVALVVSRFVDAAARREVEAAQTRGEAQTLAGLAATIEDDDPLPRLLDHLCTVLVLDGAAVLRPAPGTAGWSADAEAGLSPPAEPTEADLVKDLGAGAVLALRGRLSAAEHHIVLNAFAARLTAGIEHRRLRAEAAEAQALGEANALRTALLQAVSHDLRTPLAAIKASATSLEQRDVAWSVDQTADFVHTITEETDRLTALVGNLLDMSRIQVGAVEPMLEPVALEEIVPAALVSLGAVGEGVVDDVGETLPMVEADAALLERVVANLVQNAVRHSPPGEPVRVEAGTVGRAVHLRVIDRGPGIPPADRERVFLPFQRSTDARSHPAGPVPAAGAGVGLGLAVAKGFLSAMGAEIVVEDTPGGGATMLVVLPTVERGGR